MHSLQCPFCYLQRVFIFLLIYLDDSSHFVVLNLVHNLLSTYQPARPLRSQDNHLLTKPSVYTSIGCRAFSYADRKSGMLYL